LLPLHKNKSPKQLPNFLRRTETDVVLIIFNGDVCAVTISYQNWYFAPLRRKSKDWKAQHWDNVSEWKKNQQINKQKNINPQ